MKDRIRPLPTVEKATEDLESWKELHQALDGPLGLVAVRMKEGRAVIALDDGEGPARAQHAHQRAQRLLRSGQVLEHEAHEHVVEAGGRKRQLKDIGFEKGRWRRRGPFR